MATHDYVIDNSTGANVRADINNVLQAILTNNSSSSSPSTTAAYMFWADTTTGILKIRNSSNNAWVELFQLDGTLTLEDGSASTPALAFRDDLNTGIFSSAADSFNVATGGVERLELGAETIFNESGADVDFRIEGDSNQHLFFLDAANDKIGINQGSPKGKFHILSSSASITSANADADELVLENNGNCGITIASSTSTQGAIAFADSGNDDIGKIVYDHSDNSMFFKTADLERLRIDSSGRVLIGHTTSTPMDNDANNPIFAVEGTGNGARIAVRSDDTTAGNGAFIYLTRTRGTSAGSKTTVQSGDSLGGFIFMGADGTHDTRAAIIQAECDGTPGNDDMPGRLVFMTTPDGGINSSERMRIDSSGNTHFGGTGTLNDSNVVSIIPADGRISFGMDGRDSLVTGESGCYIFSGSGSSGSILAGELVLQSRSNTNRDMHFATGATPTMRGRFRGSDGDFFLGNDLGSITTVGTALRENDAGGHSYIEIGHGTTGAAYAYMIFRFGSSGTSIGQIAQNSSGNGVTFNTSSDYRLKTNEALITDGITRIKQLKPYKFEWKSDLGTKVDGFFAHEVSSIVPEAITGTKDAVETTYYDDEKYLPEGKSVGDVKETDKPVYQSIDHSKLVPLLVAAVQELIAKVETLEAA